MVTSGDDLVYYEAIYSPKRGSTSVCVAQSFPNMVPFISAIEVRSLSSDMYGHVDSNHALFLRRRVAFGASDIIRYIYIYIRMCSLFGFNFCIFKNIFTNNR